MLVFPQKACANCAVSDEFEGAEGSNSRTEAVSF